MRVLGVDPGSAATGYGIVERHAGRYEYLTAGVIRGNRRLSFGGKLLNIHETLCGLISDYLPAAMSLERSFVAAKAPSASARCAPWRCWRRPVSACPCSNTLPRK
jgi:crossover junction endodeoxyribonuclease RuvC